MHVFSRLCALLLFVGAAYGQPEQALQDPGQKRVQMVRTEIPPVIDGVLDDAVWSNAAVVDNLHQNLPLEYAEPYEHTEFYLQPGYRCRTGEIIIEQQRIEPRREHARRSARHRS